jgi:DNA polymerase (family 10)
MSRQRLKGAADPQELFCSVPGIGPSLAHANQATLHIDSLEDLETAAHDGRLRQGPGFGARRATMVRSALAELLARIRPPPPRVGDEPEIALLLDVDREYATRRPAVRCGRSRRSGSIRVARRGCRSCIPSAGHGFTALCSNTALAHRLGRTGDWGRDLLPSRLVPRAVDASYVDARPSASPSKSRSRENERYLTSHSAFLVHDENRGAR